MLQLGFEVVFFTSLLIKSVNALMKIIVCKKIYVP